MRLRALSEGECYARCYPGGDESVRILSLPPRPPRGRSTISGEELRRHFERRLDARDEEEAAA